MKLSKDQVAFFWRLWGAACRANGWTVEKGLSRADIDAIRKDCLAALGFSSLHQVDRAAGFDAVRAALLMMTDNLSGTIETDHPELGELRRLRWKLAEDIMPRLAASGLHAAEYVAAIVRDKFGLAGLDLDRLSAAQLRQLVVTLTARLRRIGARAPSAATASG